MKNSLTIVTLCTCLLLTGLSPLYAQESPSQVFTRFHASMMAANSTLVSLTPFMSKAAQEKTRQAGSDQEAMFGMIKGMMPQHVTIKRETLNGTKAELILATTD
jgi:hypothetical protein